MNRLVCLIPARAGSKRMKGKNTSVFIQGKTLVDIAIIKALTSFNVDDIYVSTDCSKIAKTATAYGVNVLIRNESLADDNATSEDYILDFFRKVKCSGVIQLHTIAPLVSDITLADFIRVVSSNSYNAIYSVSSTVLECFYNSDPLNFSLELKENSQNLRPVQEVNWALTYWKAESFITSVSKGLAGTWQPNHCLFEIDRIKSIVIKTEKDFLVCKKLFGSV